MHMFDELINRCTSFTLLALNELHNKISVAVQTSGATSHVKGLQMIQLQKAIMAVGMFSLFEAILQDDLKCADGFDEAAKILNDERKIKLRDEFLDFQMAINVLKHGRGRSYKALVAKSPNLPFIVKSPTEYFFNEGDVSEISTLIEVDDIFVQECARIIQDVSNVIRGVRPY